MFCFQEFIYNVFQVNLREGVPDGCTTHTCTAGAGTLLLEFGILSRLSDDPVFEGMARRVNRALWKHRSESTGLFGEHSFGTCLVSITVFSTMR